MKCTQLLLIQITLLVFSCFMLLIYNTKRSVSAIRSRQKYRPIKTIFGSLFKNNHRRRAPLQIIERNLKHHPKSGKERSALNDNVNKSRPPYIHGKKRPFRDENNSSGTVNQNLKERTMSHKSQHKQHKKRIQYQRAAPRGRIFRSEGKQPKKGQHHLNAHQKHSLDRTIDQLSPETKQIYTHNPLILSTNLSYLIRDVTTNKTPSDFSSFANSKSWTPLFDVEQENSFTNDVEHSKEWSQKSNATKKIVISPRGYSGPKKRLKNKIVGVETAKETQNGTLREPRRLGNDVTSEIFEKERSYNDWLGFSECGSKDMGFCDMSFRYPSDSMANMFLNCPDDFGFMHEFLQIPDEMNEDNPHDTSIEYSNSSRSVSRTQLGGSWTWKAYPDPPDPKSMKPVCDSEQRFIRPGYARDVLGQWHLVVQSESFAQRVYIDICRWPNQQCYLMSDCGFNSRCIQRYNFQQLLVLKNISLDDSSGFHNFKDRCQWTFRAFKFPSGCVCHTKMPQF